MELIECMDLTGPNPIFINPERILLLAKTTQPQTNVTTGKTLPANTYVVWMGENVRFAISDEDAKKIFEYKKPQLFYLHASELFRDPPVSSAEVQV